MQGHRIDMVGKRFGRLLGVKYMSTSNDGKAMWLFRCDCGAECVVSGRNVRHGITKSCGCLHREVSAKINASHGLSNSGTYMSWNAMNGRCHNPTHSSYKKYGAIGITVCDRWRHSFENFLADMGERPIGMTLDRNNPFGNYEPANCSWATPERQSLNRRGNFAIELLKKMGIDPRPAKAFDNG